MFELAGLQIDQHKALQHIAVEDQIDGEVITVHRDPLLSADEAEPAAEFEAETPAVDRPTPVRARVGRPPKGLGHVRFVNRSNPHRIMLNHLEIAFLEVLADFDNLSEIDWPAAVPRLRRIAADTGVDLQHVGAVAKHERRPGITDRIDSLVSA